MCKRYVSVMLPMLSLTRLVQICEMIITHPPRPAVSDLRPVSATSESSSWNPLLLELRRTRVREDFSGLAQTWTINTGQGQTFMWMYLWDVPWTFILAGSCFSTVLQLGKKKKKKVALEISMCKRSFYFLVVGILIVNTFLWIAVRWVCLDGSFRCYWS